MNSSSTLLDFIFVLAFAYFMLLRPGQAMPVYTSQAALPRTIQSTAFSHDLQLPNFGKSEKRSITVNQIKYPFKQAANKAQRFGFATKEKYFELRSEMKYALGWHEEGRLFQAKADKQAGKYNALFMAAKKRRDDMVKEKTDQQAEKVKAMFKAAEKKKKKEDLAKEKANKRRQSIQ